MPGTALAVQRGAAVAAAMPAVASPVDFAGMMQMAEVLVQTRFLPEHIKTPAQAVAIILTGQELGMPPMRALRSLQMVKGKVSESADSQLARFKSDGGRAEFLELTDTAATLRLRHPNGDEHTESFTLADAQKAGLAGPGSMYQKYPKAMLRSRAITGGLKSLGWEGGSGVYDPDEARAFGGAAALGEPTDDADADGVVDEPEPEPLTLEAALAYPLPGGPKAFNGQGGKALGACSARFLKQVRKWAGGQVEEHGESGTLTRLLEAVALVLPVKEEAERQVIDAGTPAAQAADAEYARAEPPTAAERAAVAALPDPVAPNAAAAVAEAVGEAQQAKKLAASPAGANDALPF